MTLSASAAEIYSSNTVGYQKINLSQGFNMVGMQFNAIGGAELPLATAVKLDSSMAGFDGSRFQTTMQVWTGSGYTTYGWLDADDGTNNDVPDWNSKWLTSDQESLAVVDITNGNGLWINTPTAATITVAGEIANADTPSIPINTGYNLVCNPLPQAVNIQNIQPSQELLGLDGSRFQTTMQVWTGSGYTSYGWLDADDGTNNDVPDWNSKWLTSKQDSLADVEIGVGEGFWIISPNATGSVTFTK